MSTPTSQVDSLLQSEKSVTVRTCWGGNASRENKNRLGWECIQRRQKQTGVGMHPEKTKRDWGGNASREDKNRLGWECIQRRQKQTRVGMHPEKTKADWGGNAPREDKNSLIKKADGVVGRRQGSIYRHSLLSTSDKPLRTVSADS